jgi:hypothetical protein
MATKPPSHTRIYVIRASSELLGTLEGPTKRAAIAPAIGKFGIAGEQQSRLVAQCGCAGSLAAALAGAFLPVALAAAARGPVSFGQSVQA